MLAEVFAQGADAVAFGGVVAAGEEGDARFAGKMGAGFGNFAGDEGVRTGVDGGFKPALRAAAAPGQRADGARFVANDQRFAPVTLRQLARQRVQTDGRGRLPQPAEVFVTKMPTGLPAETLRDLRVVAAFGVGVQR